MRIPSAHARLLVAWIIVTALLPDIAGAQVLPEQVKAAFLVNFAKFVQWPADAFDKDGTITIGVLGDDPFGNALDEAARGKVVDGRKIRVRRLKAAEDWSKVQILFVSDSEKDALRPIFQRLAAMPVLTVSDIGHFGRSGGAVELITKDNRVQFEINLGGAEPRGLKISSKLLSLATKVHER